MIESARDTWHRPSLARRGFLTRLLLVALLGLLARPVPAAGQQRLAGESAPDPGLTAALEGFYAALQAEDTERAGGWLSPDFFYIAPWGAMELRAETLERYREAFQSERLQDYRAEVRALHTGPAGEGAVWFRAIVREKYRRESGRKARNAFAEDLLTSGVAVEKDGAWRIRLMQQTWSDETLRQMVPILHAAQPVDPEEY
jgi:hypothetical protein